MLHLCVCEIDFIVHELSKWNGIRLKGIHTISCRHKVLPVESHIPYINEVKSEPTTVKCEARETLKRLNSNKNFFHGVEPIWTQHNITYLCKQWHSYTRQCMHHWKKSLKGKNKKWVWEIDLKKGSMTLLVDKKKRSV